MRIFVVEDSAIIRVRLISLLGRIAGTSVVGEAESEQQALALIPPAQPDLVILDLSLSPGNGFVVLKTLRADGFTGMIFIFTSETLEHYRRQSVKLGADGFYDKGAGGLDSMIERIRGAL